MRVVRMRNLLRQSCVKFAKLLRTGRGAKDSSLAIDRLAVTQQFFHRRGLPGELPRVSASVRRDAVIHSASRRSDSCRSAQPALESSTPAPHAGFGLFGADTIFCLTAHASRSLCKSQAPADRPIIGQTRWKIASHPPRDNPDAGMSRSLGTSGKLENLQFGHAACHPRSAAKKTGPSR